MRMNRTSGKKRLAASAVAVSLATVGLIGVTPTVASAASCPDNGWRNITQARVNDNFKGTGVNIRTGPSTSCTSIGQGQPTHDTVLHCYKVSGGYLWTHLYNLNTAKNGWVRGDLLHINSGNLC